MGVVVFIVKQPRLLIEISLSWLRQKCAWMRKCFEGLLTTRLVTFPHFLPYLLTRLGVRATGDQNKLTAALNKTTDFPSTEVVGNISDNVLKGRLHQVDRLKCVYRACGVLQHVWRQWYKAFCGSRGSCMKSDNISSGDVTQWLSCIVGNVGVFWKGKQMYGMRKRRHLWFCRVDFVSRSACF